MPAADAAAAARDRRFGGGDSFAMDVEDGEGGVGGGQGDGAGGGVGGGGEVESAEGVELLQVRIWFGGCLAVYCNGWGITLYCENLRLLRYRRGIWRMIYMQVHVNSSSCACILCSLIQFQQRFSLLVS